MIDDGMTGKKVTITWCDHCWQGLIHGWDVLVQLIKVAKVG